MKLIVHVDRNEQGSYVAVCPTLPGCRSSGKTRQDAIERLDDAVRGYIAAVSNFVPERFEHEIVEV